MFREKLHKSEEYRTLSGRDDAADGANAEPSTSRQQRPQQGQPTNPWAAMPPEDREMLTRYATVLLLFLIWLELRRGGA